MCGCILTGTADPTDDPGVGVGEAATYYQTDGAGATLDTWRWDADTSTWVKLPGQYSGTGSPEGVQSGVVSSRYTPTDVPGVIWIKVAGSGNTGWALNS